MLRIQQNQNVPMERASLAFLTQIAQISFREMLFAYLELANNVKVIMNVADSTQNHIAATARYVRPAFIITNAHIQLQTALMVTA